MKGIRLMGVVVAIEVECRSITVRKGIRLAPLVAGVFLYRNFPGTPGKKYLENSLNSDLTNPDTGDNNTLVPSRNLQRDMKGPAPPTFTL
jgi:hypothetical protein